MGRIAYVNGRYVPHGEAQVHVEDRGYQFADGVYEVVSVKDSQLVDAVGHLDRLERSLAELSIAMPMTRTALEMVMKRMVRRNHLRDGLVYMQVTRGVSPRDFKFPKRVRPAIVMTARAANFTPRPAVEDGVKVITTPDIRWKRRDIKSVALLPQVLAKQKAAENGAFEAWMVEDGFVTEGGSSNAWIVTRDGKLVTRNATSSILKGITRHAILHLCEEEGIPVEERPFTVEEAYEAREAFVSSATTFAMPVTQIDDHVIGNGKPGSLTRQLRDAYFEYADGARGDHIHWQP